MDHRRADKRVTVRLPFRLTRRRFLQGATAAISMLALNSLGRLGTALAQTPTLPPPEASGIEHIILVMMENRSFDHFLGWLNNADGRQAGLTYFDRNGVAHQTYQLAPDYQGCGHPDPDHSYEGGRIEYDNGLCDGWLRAGDNDDYAIGYYTKKDLAFLGDAAPLWTTCDRYFASIMAETFPNRIYQHAAQTDRLSNATDVSTLPTIWDELITADIDSRYYFSDVPFLALWGNKYLPIGRSIANFFADATAGTLPQVAFVDPRFIGETSGTSGDDHPYADIRNGEVFLNSIYRAVTQSPAWPNTVLVFSYDEWGGFFEHVPPDYAPIPPADQALNADGLRGFRVPCLVVSPFARRKYVSSVLFDHTSVLRMIEWRWNLPSLTVRDATANNLAEVLDFSAPKIQVRQFGVPQRSFGAPCPPTITAPAVPDKWQKLQAVAASFGWPV